MRCWLAIGLAMLAGSGFAGDWQETLTPPQPGRFPALRPLVATYKFGWSGLTAADASFDFSRVKGGRLRLAVNAKTVGIARGLWRMDAQHIGLAKAGTLSPINLQETIAYKEKTEFTQVNFTPAALERWHETKPPGASPPRWKHVALANVFDLHTALLFIRSQRMQAGDVYRLVVYPAKAPYLVEVAVLGREVIKVRGKTYATIRCDVRLQGVTKQLALQPHGKFKRALVWVSDDRDRLIVKIQAEIFVGSVWAELDTVKFAAP